MRPADGGRRLLVGSLVAGPLGVAIGWLVSLPIAWILAA